MQIASITNLPKGMIRKVLAIVACSWSALFLNSCQCAAAKHGSNTASFRFEEIDDASLGLWQGDQKLLVYNFGEKSLPDVPAAGRRSSYVHPIYGLDGEVLTDDFPADHYHHHGLFWGWPHVKIGNREYDLWKMRGIRFQFVRWLAKDADTKYARLGVENGWFVRDRQVVKEEVWLTVQPASDAGRNIDVTLKWTPLEAITLGGAEGKSYGGVTLRFAPRKNTVITGPDGQAKEDLLIAKMPWADLSATFQGAPGPSGAALFVHPQNPGYPPEWMTREYGLLAVGWPGVNPLTLSADESATCRYRVWIHRGTLDADKFQEQYQAYSETTTAEGAVP
jgi:hypothetical protein